MPLGTRTDATGAESRLDGTYKIDGRKLVLTWKDGAREDTLALTVSKLTDDELVFAEEKGKDETLVRVKDK